jgi:hypothetical protein
VVLENSLLRWSLYFFYSVWQRQESTQDQFCLIRALIRIGLINYLIGSKVLYFPGKYTSEFSWLMAVHYERVPHTLWTSIYNVPLVLRVQKQYKRPALPPPPPPPPEKSFCGIIVKSIYVLYTEYIFVLEMQQGQCICPLSWSLQEKH